MSYRPGTVGVVLEHWKPEGALQVEWVIDGTVWLPCLRVCSSERHRRILWQANFGEEELRSVARMLEAASFMPSISMASGRGEGSP